MCVEKKLCSVCFAHHADDTLLGKHDCLGLSNMFLVRHTIVPHSTEVSKIQYFKSFPEERNNFKNHHTSDLSRVMWNVIALLKLNS